MRCIMCVMIVNMYNTNMNTINITVRTDRLPTQYEIQKAICEREEAMMPYKAIEIPKMKYPKMKVDRINGHTFFGKLLP